jgi:hypothetical protein
MRRFAVLLALAAVVSCGGDSPTSPSVSVSGTYSLQTVNGAALPYAYPQDVYDKFEFLSDVRTLSDSGTFTETYTNRQTQNGVATTFSRTVTGTYTVVGGGITFFHPEGKESGSVGAGKLTLRSPADGIVAAVYQKEGP